MGDHQQSPTSGVNGLGTCLLGEQERDGCICSGSSRLGLVEGHGHGTVLIISRSHCVKCTQDIIEKLCLPY